MSKFMSHTIKHLCNLLLFFVPSIIFFSITFIPRMRFLLNWYFRLIDNFFIGFLLYLLFFTVLYAVIQFFLNKKKEPPYIEESSFSSYFIFITFTTFLIFLYMLYSTLFLTNYYSVVDFLYGLVAYIIGLLIVYIPIQFVVFIGDSNIISTLFSLFIRYFIQVLFFFILYIIIFSS